MQDSKITSGTNQLFFSTEPTEIKEGQGPIDYEVKAGTPATFRCAAQKDESLELTIDWLKNDKPINFGMEPRFVKTNDNSLTITKTTELDSGEYTCLASTKLDNATAKATLIVQDIPNPPELTGLVCYSREARLDWISNGDNRAPILNYIIQYNTTFAPDSWNIADDNVPGSAVDTKVCDGFVHSLSGLILSFLWDAISS